jgi:hypothetical protein
LALCSNVETKPLLSALPVYKQNVKIAVSARPATMAFPLSVLSTEAGFHLLNLSWYLIKHQKDVEETRGYSFIKHWH